MIVAEAAVKVIIEAIGRGFGNVAFAASLLVTIGMAAGVVIYSKRRPVGAPLSWGTSMVAAVYVTFGLVMAFGILPDRWMAHAEGNLKMRSDAILAGPGSTGWLQDLPVRISKATVSDFVTVNIYMIGVVITVAMWAVWQGRGKTETDAVERSTYGRPLVKG